MSRDWELFLDDIADSIGKIRAYVEGLDLETFSGSAMVADAVVWNLEVIGEATKHIPQDIRQGFGETDWHGFAGLRDVLVHAYFGVILRSSGT